MMEKDDNDEDDEEEKAKDDSMNKDSERPSKSNKESKKDLDKIPCHFFFRRGKCIKGEKCRYSHEESSRTSHNQEKIELKDKINVKCRFYERGYCREGKECRFQHKTKEVDTSSDNTEEEREEKKKNIDCFFAKRGKCNKGEDCNYRHPKNEKKGVQSKHSLASDQDLLRKEKKQVEDANNRIAVIKRRISNNIRRPAGAR